MTQTFDIKNTSSMAHSKGVFPLDVLRVEGYGMNLYVDVLAPLQPAINLARYQHFLSNLKSKILTYF